ncbi:MAG: phage tail protein [Candidimonas sp.]|nr:MAG: phage tail protein [Candidimonas sp.]TAM23762.1 MAG: phage tail protein [Candidimonas sp.]
MTIGFQHIPQSLRVPLFYAEVNNSAANSATLNQRALIIGQKLAAGAATPNVPQIYQGDADIKAQCGQGSIVALMAAAYRKNDAFGELWYLPLADDPAAVAATGTITLTGAATVNGVLSLYIGGVLVSVSVSTTQTVTQIASAIVTAIGLNPDLPITATSALGVVTLTAANKGIVGNELDVRLNYQGVKGGEQTPAGLVATIVAFANGATNPVLTTGLGNLNDMPFDFIACATSDTTTLDALKAFLDDNTGRWSYLQQIYGHAFTSIKGTLGTVTAVGTARNDPHTTILPFPESPTPSYLWTAALVAQTATSVRADPGLPLQTLPLVGILPPAIESRWDTGERNTLLYSGLSSFNVADDGTVQLENIVTTYQKNAFGSPDDSYLEVETLFLLAYVLRDMRGVVTSKFARTKLAQDGTRFAPGANIVTPKIIKSNLVARFAWLEENGYVQDSVSFEQKLIVQINSTNPNRVDVLWPGTLINQLRIFAVLAQFRL